MSATMFQERRAIRAYREASSYDEARREAIHAAEREAAQREVQAPEPCNFCAPDDELATVGLCDYLATVLGRFWPAWLAAFAGLCMISAALGALLALQWWAA